MHKLFISFTVILVIIGITVSHMSAAVDTNTSEAWARPNAKTMVRVGPAPDLPEQPNFLSNLDCTEIQYKSSQGGALSAGCFSDTAFGMIDPDSELVIYNGTDEALPLEAYSAHQVLVPWTRSGVLIALDAINTGGSIVSIYKNITAELVSKRALNGQLSSKQISQPPDITLRFSDGQALIINPQTMAFSSNGSWMIAETLRGAFIRVNLATLEVMPFAQSYAALGNPAMLKSLVSVSNNGQFVAIANSYASSFRVYDLNTCTASLATIATNPCANFDYWPFVQTSAGAFSSIQHLRFINTGLLSFELLQSTGKSVYELAPTVSISSLTNYIGLGDSYSSGEGAFDYIAGTDTANNMCHQSVQSYPFILTRLLYGEGGGHSVACSGAVINDIAPKSPKDYRGQVSDSVTQSTMSDDYSNQILADYTPGVLGQQNFIAHYQPTIVTVGVGGNDIGFGDVLQNCVEPHVSIHLSDSVCFGTYEDRIEQLHLIDSTVPRWTALYRQLATQAPQSTIYAVGYPQISVDTGKCGLNVHLSKSELEFAQELINYLNNRIAKAAQSAGVTYVDINNALVGHRLCETSGYNIAVNGLTSGTAAGALGINFLGKESYHPNAFGQQLIAEAILARTSHFKTKQSSTPVPTAANISDVAATGRTIHSTIPAQLVTNTVIKRGGSVSIQTSGQRIGLQPNSVYYVTFGESTTTNAGSITSDTYGVVAGEVIVPIDAAAGGTTVHLIGPSASDKELDIHQPIFIAVTDSDFDGDGVVNTADACPYAVNTGIDEDSDGIDDTCDPIIGPPTDTINQQSPTITDTTPNNSSGNAYSVPVSTATKLPAKTRSTVSINSTQKPKLSPSVCTNCSVLGSSTEKSTVVTAVRYPALLKLVWPWWLVVPLMILGVIRLLTFLGPKIWVYSRHVLSQKLA